jgi:predicted nucleic acid-binding protein
VVELLVGGRRAADIHAHLASEGQAWHAPHLIEVEVCHVFRRLNLSRQMTDLRGRQALRDLSALGLSLHEHGPLLPRAWSLRANLSAYDAMYVALAEGLRAPLLTLDAKLAKTTGHVAKIEVL